MKKLQVESIKKKFKRPFACAHSRLGETNEALKVLGNAVELGFTNADHAVKDPDLEPIRDLPGFDDIMNRMQSKEKKEKGKAEF